MRNKIEKMVKKENEPMCSSIIGDWRDIKETGKELQIQTEHVQLKDKKIEAIAKKTVS